MDFVYTSNDEPITYSQWDTEKSQPNKENPRANCVQVQDHDGDWGDIHCHAKRKYVCEVPSSEPQLYWDGVTLNSVDSKAEALKRYIFEKFFDAFPQRTTEGSQTTITEAYSKHQVSLILLVISQVLSSLILIDYLSIGGANSSLTASKEVYLVNLQSGQACLHSELPEELSEAQVHIFRRRLLVCSSMTSSSTGTLKCFIWSQNNGWERFATPDGNSINGTTNSVLVPNVGVWFFDGNGDSLLLNENTGDWETPDISWTTVRTAPSCAVQISDTLTANIGDDTSFVSLVIFTLI